MNSFLADESVDYRLVTTLREKGYDVKAILDIKPSISDDAVLNIAVESNYVLITEDKDFGELAFRLKKTNNGILLLRFVGISIEEKKEKLLTIIEKYSNQLNSSFIVLTAKKVRIRKQ